MTKYTLDFANPMRSVGRDFPMRIDWKPIHTFWMSTRLFAAGVLVASGIGLSLISACKSRPLIAVLGQTSGTPLSLAQRYGVEKGAGGRAQIYWNAPSREDAVDEQIELLNRAISQKHPDGVILSPDHSLALMSSAQRALANRIPLVVVGTSLELSPRENLAFVLNDEEAGARLAVGRLALLLNGHGRIAILGIDPAMVGVMERFRAVEALLATSYPNIEIATKSVGSFNTAREQQNAREILSQEQHLDAILALNPGTMTGTLLALREMHLSKSIALIGFDQAESLNIVRSGQVDSIVVENGVEMGRQAAELILRHDRKQMATRVLISPVLVTAENLNDPAIQAYCKANWSF